MFGLRIFIYTSMSICVSPLLLLPPPKYQANFSTIYHGWKEQVNRLTLKYLFPPIRCKMQMHNFVVLLSPPREKTNNLEAKLLA